MSISTNILSCVNLQDMLDGHFGELGAQVSEPNFLLPFLLSPTNTNNLLNRKQSPGGGKRRTVELTYKQRLQESAVSTVSTLSCEGGDERGNLSTTYSLDGNTGISYPWSYTLSQYEENCDSDGKWLAEEFAAILDVLRRKASTQIASDIVANVGDFYNSTDAAQTVKTSIDSQAGSVSYDLVEKVKWAYSDMGWNGSVFAVGNNELIKYGWRLDSSCCVTTHGIDPGVYASNHPVMFIQDRAIQNAFADNANGNKFVAIAPGAVQVLYWNEFMGERGIREFNDETKKAGVIYDPVTGLPFDYYVEFSCGKWNFQLKLALDTAFLPSDMFEVVDPYHGVNWVNRFTISNS